VFRFAFPQVEDALDGKEVGEQLPEQEQNQASMDHENADLLPSQTEALNVGGDQVDQEHGAEQVSSRKHGNFPIASRRPVNKKAPEEAMLGGIEPFIDLGKRAD